MITADEARRKLTETDEYKDMVEALKCVGERNIKNAIRHGDRRTHTGLNKNNKAYWPPLIEYWESLGYRTIHVANIDKMVMEW